MPEDRVIRLSSEVSLPASVLGETIAIVGMRGSGKTTTAKVIIEQARRLPAPAGPRQAIVIDPTDAWWGLTLGADGEPDGGVEMLVLGGRHSAGGIDLEEHHAAPLARAILEHRLSCVLSLRLLESASRPGRQSLAAHVRFGATLFQDLYRFNAEHRRPMTLAIDEASEFVPQSVTGSVAACCGAVERIVLRGRIDGFGVILIDQRCAKINKNVLTQADTLIAHRNTSKQDRDAVLGWIEHHAPDSVRAVGKSLGSLGPGEAFVFSPRHGVFALTQIDQCTTWNSSDTPSGEAIQVRADASAGGIPLEDLRGLLAPPKEEKKSADESKTVKELRAELAEARRELDTTRALYDEARSVIEQVRSALDGLERRSVEVGVSAPRLLDKRERTNDHSHGARSSKVRAVVHNDGNSGSVGDHRRPAQNAPERRESRPGSHTGRARPGAGTATQRILNAVATLSILNVDAPTRTQVVALAGMSPKSGTTKGAFSDLNEAGLLYMPETGRVRLTDAGKKAAQWPDEASSRTIQGLIHRTLSAAEREIFDVIWDAGEPISREDIAAAVGKSATSGSTKGALAKLCSTLEVCHIPSTGMVELAPWLQEIA